ncbi:type IV toxin-antitoxin system AbiEi family antitoxin domain-containing protein [Nocardioides sp.]|uniref:type IV toxin-antitoxin system AbiEi family antitoxin domain-containing protein n=1 Tax=Nocardioides sp. TaxID=35761 RepID=UPI0035AF4B2A
MEQLAKILANQSGVVSRRQALSLGLEPHDLRRLVRRRDLTPLFPGTFVDHTGVPTWIQRAWAAVLFCAPREPDVDCLGSALAGRSAVRAADGPGRGEEDGPVVVAIARDRRLVAPSGITVVRTYGLDERVQWNLGPPRMRYDEAALDVALACAGELDAVGAIARAVQGRHTTARRMQDALTRRSRAPRRAFLEAVLADVAAGSCSVLEREYLERVVRPHRLPVGQRQLPDGTLSGVVYRDTALGEVLVELDGRLFHDTAEQRDHDHERDLDAAVEGLGTVRLTWGQVVGRPCCTAAKLSRILVRAGWPHGRPCGTSCGWLAAA